MLTPSNMSRMQFHINRLFAAITFVWMFSAGAASATARTSFFEPFDFATDERQRPLQALLFARNWLIGGVPGSGNHTA